MGKDNGLISIIIPVYNMGDFIASCLSSVTCQTYENIEIIIVNDGSTDRTEERCEEWQQKDSRIKYIRIENHGVSFARNIGLEAASGKYIVFVDADDVVEKDYLQTLSDVAENYEADMVITKCVSFDVGEKAKYIISDNSTVICEDLPSVLFTIANGVIGGKLFRHKVIKENSICFSSEIAILEDMCFCLDYIRKSRRLVFNHSALYGYLQHTSSATHNNFSSKWFDCLHVYRKLEKEFRDDLCYKYIVYFYLKNMYEAKYILKRNKKLADWEGIKAELERMEKKRTLLSKRMRLKLMICKFFFWLLIIKRRV